MPVDFSGLVLNPAMATFARNVVIDPVDSRPGKLSYTARGVFTSTNIDVIGQDGSVMSDQKTTLGIRLADFDGPPPRPRDAITIDAIRYIIDDIHVDGQGGATLTLRKRTPDYPQ